MSFGTTPELSEALARALGSQYRLERELGRGAMGVVYLATDLTLHRTVAVKVIKPELALNQGLAERFLAEARLIARLRHPNIVSVYAAGASEGLLYYVMDHVPGESLRDSLQRDGRLEPDMAASYLADMAAALDAAAAAGVVHRDVKPENILLDRSGSGTRALLADFGIALALADDVNRTGPGMALGTPAYMSPEQAAGEAVTAQSDLYSLGVVGFEMLAGRPPFQGSRQEVLSRHIVERPPSLGRLCPDAPSYLVDAIDKALEKAPENRWSTGAALRAALVGRQRVPRPRRRLVVAVAAAAVFLSAALFATRQPGGAAAGVNPRHSLLVLPFTNLRGDSGIGWLAQGSVSMLDLALSQWRDLRVVGHERVHDLVQRNGFSEGEVVGLEDARRMARSVGVWTVVLGEFERARDSLHLVARAYDVATGDRLDVAEVRGRMDEDVRPLFDDLANRLLNLSGAPVGDRANLAAATTSSLEAYRSYLAGQEALKQWDLASAETAFAEAVRIDTTFSLAFFRLAVTRGWVSAVPDSLTRHYLGDAIRFSDRLPERERTMVEAYRALIEGHSREAQSLYSQLVVRDSSDAEAWYGLGDAWFHDLSNPDRPAAMTESLKAFRRTIELDPRFALAYDHVNAMLSMAARDNPSIALLPNGRLAPVRNASGTSLIPEADLRTAVSRARLEGIATAQSWVDFQPGTIRARRALMDAYVAAGDRDGALAAVEAIRAVPVEGAAQFAAFLEARTRLATGDPRGAANAVRAVLPGLRPSRLAMRDLGQEAIFDVLSGASALAYVGDVAGAEIVIRAAGEIRAMILPETSIMDAYGDGRVWVDGRLASLYAAVGLPPGELETSWGRVRDQARLAPQRERALLAWAGASAAQGLLLSPTPDAGALRELEQLTGVPARPEFQALAALAGGDTAAARRALADKSAEGKEKGTAADAMKMWPGAGFGTGDYRPAVAEVRFQLGDYEETVRLLAGFEAARLPSRGFDARWGLLARVRLLRGLALERLDRRAEAEGEFRQVLAQWEGADERLQGTVQEARAGLARLRGAGG
ncbi:MAG TPA: serine/threonine-protein kinase [Gemmatimonadales bacterium]|nr:serine/threonine-protein kinase [Gemmatimonadales bacterium]